MSGGAAGPRPDGTAYLDQLFDHEVSSAGISAGDVAGLNLDGVTAVADALGVGDSAVRIVHVTGTNGKGTVVRLVESLVAASGLRVGTYTSPEGTVNERIRIDCAPISEVELSDALSSVRGAAEVIGQQLTVFEAVTLAALVAFADAPVDVAIIEVGLLGRFDATNVVEADVAVITNVGGDHTDFADGWEERVAWEKAGIVEAGGVAVIGTLADRLIHFVEAEQPAVVVRLDTDFSCIENRLAVGGRALEVVTSQGTRIEAFVPLHGDHQGQNVAIAAEAAEMILGGTLDAEASSAALESVAAPGRIEVVATDPMVILDGAHNAEAAAALGDTLSEAFVCGGRRVLVMGALAGRDPQRFLGTLIEHFPFDAVVPVTIAGPRGLEASDIAAAAQAMNLAVLQGGNITDAVTSTLDRADVDDLIVVSGSFRLIDEARAAVAARS